jgi:hypothetical protein
MRNLLAGLAAVVLIVAGAGWYLGWFHVQTAPTSDGHRKIEVDVDTKKISGDVHKGVQEGTQKVEEWLHKKDGQSQTTAPASPPPIDRNSAPSRTNDARFIVKDGAVEYTGEVFTPKPINPK